MKRPLKSTLLILPFLFINTSFAQNSAALNPQMFCKEWVLVQTTHHTNKSIYRSDGSEHFTLNCTANSWVRYDSTEGSTTFGTWQIKDSNLELKMGDDILVFNIISNDERTMILSANGLTFEYVRK